MPGQCGRFGPHMPKFLLCSLLLLASACTKASAAALPAPSIDESVEPSGDRFAVFAGGCFWGIEAVFEHVDGVKKVTSGYSGGTAATAHYDAVSTGLTGHAESVQVVYDPSRI